ncbi:ADF-like domain-containing protein [Sclerotinia borealis F-4128]|uniref:ADF-like domain-containing protein n=1 Tax=Sclerotinia borealis (strain F-4128) TaxID=1432307 RepID=W9CSQ4_SCLBF|nr:ADF-like domain-containing protein [Sclerotinia borealis F-4128]
MSNAKSPEILAAYDDVRSDKSPINWLIISYAKTTGDSLALTATGEGGLAGLREKLDPAQAQYAYLRVEYANDSETSRVKFVFIVWIGEQTKIMRKARVSIESGAVKAVLNHHSVTVDARGMEDLDEAEIVKLCRKAGGADYNGGRG